MKAIEFKEQHTIFAEHQDQYANLPARVDGNGVVTCCLELEDDELEEVLSITEIWLSRLTFGAPAQPIKISFEKPEFPISPKGFQCEPCLYGEDTEGTVIFHLPLEEESIEKLRVNKCFWLSTATYKSPLQPIGLSCCG